MDNRDGIANMGCNCIGLSETYLGYSSNGGKSECQKISLIGKEIKHRMTKRVCLIAYFFKEILIYCVLY